MHNINLNIEDFAKAVAIAFESVNKTEVPQEPAISGLAAYLLHKAGHQVVGLDGRIISKSELDETTLDFTRGRTLTEEQATIAVNYIFDKSPYLRLFNSRIVNKIVTPVKGTAITQGNLISNEQAGGVVTNVNRRIVHNFGINLQLLHAQLQTDIPLQTVIDNLYNPGFEQDTIDKVAISLGNDILNLAINGLGGVYDTNGEFYDLNLGWNKMFQILDGLETNTYGSVKVGGFLGQYLTPQRVDITGATGDNYTSANVLAAMLKINNAMLPKYRDNPNNAFLMSYADYDMYMSARSDVSGANNNTVREGMLTTGDVPRFMGKRIIPIPYWIGINEFHVKDSNLPGCILYGDPKNMDLASDSTGYRRFERFDPDGALGPAYRFFYDNYLDFHVMAPESFVVGYKGAAASKARLVAGSDSKNGTRYIAETASNAVAITLPASSDLRLVSDNAGAVIVKSPNTLANASNLTAALSVSGAAAVKSNDEPIEYTTATPFYVRTYHPNGVFLPSTQVTITVTNSA